MRQFYIKFNKTQISFRMSFFGVEINAQVNKLIFQIRLHLSRNKYLPNLRTIYRSCASFDQEISGKIQSFNFEKALNQNGIFFKKYEYQVFEKAYTENGLINWFTFLSHLRQPMGPHRRQLVEHIFDSMDSDKKGKLTTDALMSHFNPAEIQSYKLGKKNLQTTYAEFLSLFPVVQNQIPREEFIAFYDDLNINFAHDDVFFRYVSQQWHYTPEKLEAVKVQDVKVATKALRFKLIQKTQGTKDELLVRKLFQQYDTNKNYYIGPYELDLMFKDLKVPIEPRVVGYVLQKIDKNNSGYIEFEEFKKFLFHDPYPL